MSMWMSEVGESGRPNQSWGLPDRSATKQAERTDNGEAAPADDEETWETDKRENSYCLSFWNKADSMDIACTSSSSLEFSPRGSFFVG